MNNSEKRAKPFVKWAGGKGNLISQLDSLLPKYFMSCDNITYVEPFVGGGAMMFHLLKTYCNISKVIINDINEDLTECYRLIKDNPYYLIEELKKLESRFLKLSEEGKKEFYYSMREQYNHARLTRSQRATLFMFLNHTCFNGLYRVNNKSSFNVPFGKYTNPTICNESLILDDNKILNSVEIILLNDDYSKISKRLPKNGKVFVYLDPPYMPISTTSYFKQYSASPFGKDEQKALKSFCDKLSQKNIDFMLSNSDCKTDDDTSYFEGLYAGYEFQRIKARRFINAHSSTRNTVYEVVIRNYK